MSDLSKNEIIVFDGICILCNSLIKWVLDRDKKKLFYVSNLQSNFIKENHPNLGEIDSVAVILKNGNVLRKSKAIKHILKVLNRLILLRIILTILPLFLSNIFYDFIAKTRHKIFGKYDSCKIPNLKYISRFLD